MSEAEVGTEGGGAPLPPKRPTIIRPVQDGGTPAVPARPAPARPAPPPPGARAPPAVPRPLAAESAGPPLPAAAPLRPRPSGPSHNPSGLPPAPAKPPELPAKDTSRPKSQGSIRKRPEITIIDARPMSQAGFRDMKASEAPAFTKPANTATRDADSAPKPSSNGVVPGDDKNTIPARAAHSAAAKSNSTPPPSQPPPPIPPSRPGASHSPPHPPIPPVQPGAPHSPPRPHPEKPSASSSSRPKASSSDAPPKPIRPTILRPGRPRSAVETSEHSSEEPLTSPPPPLPKRSPIVADVAATGNLIDLSPPPKPVRASCTNGESLGGDKADEDVEKGEGHVTPRKPTRVSIIRPARQPKPSVEAGHKDAEGAEEPQEVLSHHPPHPKPPQAPARPVAVVAASPRDSSPTDSLSSVDAEPTGPMPPPPVPAARPRTSPRDRATELKTQPSEAPGDGKPQGLPDRPKPPVPSSRPHAPPSVSTSGAPPRLPDSAAPSKPPAPAAAASHPAPHLSRPLGGVGDGGGLPPPLIPSKLPVPLRPSQAVEGSLYAVSDPLEESADILASKLPDSSEPQPSRPPPPVPKTRPQAAHPPSPMMGRPLPSVPSQSSSDSPLSEQGHFYEDVDTVKAQNQTLVELPHADSDQTDKPRVSPRGKCPIVDTPVTETEDDIEAMYAKVNKPRKHSSPQSSVTNPSQSEDVAANPFGVKLKRVPAESSQECESQPRLRNAESESTEVKKPPVLAPKPKPGVLPRPQPAAKPKSPGAEERPPPETAAAPPEMSAKPDPAELTKPPLIAKRPTIIRPSRPAPRSGDDDQAVKSEEGSSADVQLREKSAASRPRPQSQSGEDSKVPVPEPPVPSKRPVTIIGFPNHRQKPPEPEAAVEVRNTSPVPKQRSTVGEASPREERDKVDPSSQSAEGRTSSAASEGVGTPPPVSRPPPPRPDNKPPRPQQGQPSPPPEPAARQRRNSESPPPRPPSPAPPRPANRPAAPSKEAAATDASAEVGGASALPSTPRFAPPVKRKGSSEEEEVRQQPPRPNGPPARPVSMPPVKPPLAAAPPSPSPAGKSEKPSRPQPVRPAAPKEVPKLQPALPLRPGLSHPLYSYIAGEPHAIALHDYPALQHDELPFQEGDTVLLLRRVDDQWLVGRVRDKEGIFPQNFVDIIHPLHDELPSSAIDDMIDGVFEEALQEKPDLLHGPRCRARFDFEGEGHGDLAFEDGDVIQLLAHCGDDWLKGELNGKVGMFPASFVEIIEDLPEDKGSRNAPRGKGSEVTALFDFSGEPGELSFQAGDRICILSKVNDQWLFGQSGGNQGSFPASFVDAIPQDLPLYEPPTASQGPSAVAQSSQQGTTSDKDMHGKPKRFCTALYSFEKAQEEDLEFQEGDHIEVVEEVGQDWLRGRLAGREGIFPASFVQLDTAGAASSPAVDMNELGSTGLELHSALVVGKALFDFDGQADNELTFKAGDEIVLGSMVSEGADWQWGELHGRKGMFPANFVEML